MLRTIEAVIDKDGNVKLLEAVELETAKRAYVTILDEDAEPHPLEVTLLSQDALSEDWNRPEEDEAWAYLRPAT